MKKKRVIINIIVGIIFLVVVFTFYTTFSLGEEYHFESPVYSIEDGYIYGISPNTEVSLFRDYFELENCTLQIVDYDRQEVVSGYVKNGSKTILYNNDHQVLGTYVNVIVGDISQDGKVDQEDLRQIGKILVGHGQIDDDLFRSFDVDGDRQVHLNDLLLLDKALSQGYENLELNLEQVILQSDERIRVIGTIQPNYGLIQNLKWKSLDEDIATVSESGVIVGHQEGNTVIQVQTQDGKFTKEVKVKVDNTIQLASYEGILYVGGKDGEIPIKAIDYEGITCSSSDDKIASCSIEGKNLVLKAKRDGNITITVASPNYGSVSYHLITYSTYINLFPSYGCSPFNRTGAVIISSFYAGELSFDIRDPEIIKDAYVKGNQFFVVTGNTPGRGEVMVKEANGNQAKTFVLDVYKLSIPAIGGFGKVGEEMVTDIEAEGTGELSCSSENEEIATCRVEGKKLYVQPFQLGEVTITVLNTVEYNGEKNACGTATFLAVIRE